MMQQLQFHPAIDHPNLISPTIFTLLQNWQGKTPVKEIKVTEIDPAFANGKELCERYTIPYNAGANCVIIQATRNEKRTFAACLALVNSQMDLNGIVRKKLQARKVSLAPLQEILTETQMEYGSITAFGLPPHWPILLDAEIFNVSHIVIGSGVLKSKLFLPTKALAELPGAIIAEGLALATAT